MQIEEVSEDLIPGDEFSDDDKEDDDVDSEEEEIVEGKREPYNDQDGLKLKLSQFKLDLDWIESLDATINADNINLPGKKDNDDGNKDTEIKDDFQREMFFYCQAQLAAKEAFGKLLELGIPIERPEDYFAEMVKSDAHMQKIRKKLLEKKDKLELSEKAKRQRHLKKVGKKIQQDVLQKRQKEKKKMLQEVDRMKKGKVEKLYGNSDDPFNVSTDLKSQQNRKRKRKDDKFGFGGKKRKVKKNSAESSADMTSFKSHMNGKPRKNMGNNMNRKRKAKTINKNKKRGKR